MKSSKEKQPGDIGAKRAEDKSNNQPDWKHKGGAGAQIDPKVEGLRAGVTVNILETLADVIAIEGVNVGKTVSKLKNKPNLIVKVCYGVRIFMLVDLVSLDSMVVFAVFLSYLAR